MFEKKDFTISKEHGEALEKSIVKWQRRVGGEDIPEGHGNCDLCAFNGVGIFEGARGCEQCVVGMHTGKRSCKGTPYENRYLNPNYRSDVTEFLKSLRVYKGKVIRIGDTVTIQDFSYCDIPSEGGRKHYNTHMYSNVYKVIATGVELPKPIETCVPSNGSNDTIIHNVRKDYFVFCGIKRLRLLPPKCSKCGK